MAQRFSWIWLVGCLAWTFDTIVSVHVRAPQQAKLAALMALLFFVAWLFYRKPKR